MILTYLWMAYEMDGAIVNNDDAVSVGAEIVFHFMKTTGKSH